MIQLGVIVGYMLLLVVLGFLANRLFTGTSKDYMLASHSIGPFLLLMSLFGTTMTAFALLGSTGFSQKLGAGVFGMLASAGGIVHSLCFLVIGVPLWRLGRRNGYTTQIQFFRERLDSSAIGFLLFPILVMLVISYLLLGVVGAGIVINGVTQGAFAPYDMFEDAGFGVPQQWASAAICIVVLSYVFLGGMRGTAWANAVQTLLFMVLGMVTFFSIANSIGGTDNFFENLRIASQSVPEANVLRTKIPPAKFFSFLLIPLSVSMFPHVFQHWLTARNANAFKLPIVMHPIFILVVWAPCVLIGIWASSPLAGIASDVTGNQVLPELVRVHAGPWLGGLLSAGILAAIMSSLDSQFLCLGTMFTEDVVANVVPGQLSDRRRVVLARGFVIVIVVTVFLLSLVAKREIYELGVWSFSGFTGLFPLVFASIYWKRLTSVGAIASVITAVGVWAVLFSMSDFGADKRFMFPSEAVALGPVSIPPMLSVVTIFVSSATVLVIGSYLSSPPQNKTLQRFFPDAKED